MNLTELLSRPPQPGTVKITDAAGTTTYREVRQIGGSFSGPAPEYEAAFFAQLVGTRVSHRRNFRTWWQAAVRRAHRREAVNRPTQGVTRTRYWRRGAFGLGATVQFDSRGQDTDWRVRVDAPAVSVGLSVGRWRCGAGCLELHLPKLTLSVEGVLRELTISPLSVWSYPWGAEREWGVSVLRFNGASMLLWANAEQTQTANRVDVLWRHLRGAA